MSQLWIKHRPDTLSHMVGLENLKKDVPGWIVYEKNNFVLRCGGVIFSGMPGTGKTSAARAIGKDALGSAFEANYHVFNASDDRGIQFIRDRLKGLAQQKAINSTFKIINLDEADGLTKDAQDALRQIIEETSSHTLWILTCNRVSKIIPALRSRLPTYSFNPLDEDESEAFLAGVIEEEGLPAKWVEDLPALVSKCKGDMRACLKTLQICNPDEDDGLKSHLREDNALIHDLHATLVEQDYESSLTVASDIVKAGLNREDVITVLHLSLLQEFQDGTYGIAIVLKRLLILGQWAAKSPDWTSGDLLFLHAMIGDYHNRG